MAAATFPQLILSCHFLLLKMACMVAKYSSRLYSLPDSKIRAALSRHRQLPPPPPQTLPKKPPPPPPQLGPAGNEENKRKTCSGDKMKEEAPNLQTSRSLGVPEPWWEGELAEAIHRTLRLRESMLNTLKLSSSQLHKRFWLYYEHFNYSEHPPLIPRLLKRGQRDQLRSLQVL